MQNDDDPWFGVISEKDKLEFDPLFGGFANAEDLAKCRQKIVECFNEIKHEFECRSAWEVFEAFVRAPAFRPEKRKKGSHDPQYDKALLAAYDAADWGKKEKAAFAVPRKRRVSNDSIKRHLSRLLKARKQREIRFNAFEQSTKELDDLLR
jgi:hypothetical protein